MDEIDHVVQSLLDVLFLVQLVTGFEDGLDGLGATAGAGAANACRTASVVCAQFSPLKVEDRCGHSSTERLLEHVCRGHDRGGCVASLQAVDDGFAFGLNLFAEMEECVLAFQPHRVLVRASDAAPDLAFGWPECERGLKLFFVKQGFPPRGKGRLPVCLRIFLEVLGSQTLFVPEAWSTQRGEI